MSEQTSTESPAGPGASRRALPLPGRRPVRLLLVVAGILFGQAVLYGPSLCGRKLLLPLDVLAEAGVYLPAGEREKVEVRNALGSDLVYLFEPARRFAASEIRSGRLPSWAPYEYGGVPVIWPRFSPLLALEMCVESPVVLAWAQLLAALVAGSGAYLFFRRVLSVSFWPAAIGACCYPLTGFFVFWAGYPTGLAVYWLPWILTAVYGTVHRPSSLAPLGLSVAVGAALVSGHLDVAGQVLLVAGLFAVWCTVDAYRRARVWTQVVRAGLALGLGCGAGLLLASLYILPVVEYSKTGLRMERRSAGAEERPPVGLSALPQVVLPDMYGSHARHVRFVDGNQTESSAATYVGIVATLWAAPLAFACRRHRSISVFWSCLALFSLSWCLNLPGFVPLLRLPGLNLMSHNRLVFAAAFAFLALATIGLEAVAQGATRWRRWFMVPVMVLGMILAWCVYRGLFPPEPIESELARFVSEGKSFAWIRDMSAVHEVQGSFAWRYLLAAGWCAAGLAGWYLLFRARVPDSRWLPIAGAVLVADLLSFGFGRIAQGGPELYYPPVPVLKQLAGAAAGRVLGYGCFPANLAGVCGLNDIRGYDGVDPARITQLITLAASDTSRRVDYASVQQLTPNATFTPDGNVRLSPVLDLLGVRHVIFRGAVPTNALPVFAGRDYWVLENPSALPRAFIPRRVEALPDPEARLAKLAAAEFDPRQVAYVETEVGLPARCEGTVRIVRDTPSALDLSVAMTTPGLVVLADRWDPGWHASINGTQVPILQVNHAVRGVVVPAGVGTLQFRYRPSSFTTGLVLAGAGSVTLLAWAGLVISAARRQCPGDIRGSRLRSDAGR